jgi:ABC-type branched-subunit amino acid transport system ATPase component
MRLSFTPTSERASVPTVTDNGSLPDTDGILHVAELIVGYGGSAIVNGVTMTFRESTTTVLLGPNGAGKSTLVRGIVGLVSRYGGRVFLQGKDVSSLSTEQLIATGVAYVPQSQNVFTSLTIRENLEVGGRTLKRAQRRERVEEMLELFPNLRTAINRSAGTLSGGERNLLALARGLMAQPRVLLVDEPTAGLSPLYQEVVWEHLDGIKNSGVCVVVVEQNTQAALQHADWAYVLVLGKTRMAGRASEIRDTAKLAELYLGARGGVTG